MNCKTSSHLSVTFSNFSNSKDTKNSFIWVLLLARLIFILWALIYSHNQLLSELISNKLRHFIHIKAILALMKVTCSFISATTFPGYISMYIEMSPCVEVCMANVSSEFPLIWGVKVLCTYQHNPSQLWYLQYGSTVYQGSWIIGFSSQKYHLKTSLNLPSKLLGSIG